MGTLKTAGRVAKARATSGRDAQNFLGARWVTALLSRTPASRRRHVAIRLLALSPHYMYDSDVEAEIERNRRTRRTLIEALVVPHLTGGDRVLDYGCGAGFAAVAAAEHASHVYAVDVSPGVIACADILNGRDNVTYHTVAGFGVDPAQVDLAYSFAVLQHLTSEVLAEAMSLLARSVRPGGKLLAHFAAPENGWRTEGEWRSDSSVAGWLRARHGLNCFGRLPEEMVEIASEHGFAAEAMPVAEVTDKVDDDIAAQWWLVAIRT